MSSQAVSAEWLYVGEPGEFRGSRRLQRIVERSQVPCHVVEHDFGVILGGCLGWRLGGNSWGAKIDVRRQLDAIFLKV